MPSEQVQMFVPLLGRSDTTRLGAGIQAPTSTPTHCAQPPASVAAGSGGTVVVVPDMLHHSDPSPLPMLGQHQQELGQRLGRGGIC